MTIFEKGDRQLARLSEAQFYLIALILTAVSMALFMASLALSLHWNFLTTACDTAAFQNAIVNTMHGQPFRETAYDGPNLLGLHTSFVLLLVVPVYALFPYVTTLFILQIGGLYSAVIPLYFASLELLKKPSAAFFVAATALVSPIFAHLAMAPFHPETWIGAAILWSYFFYLRNWPVWYWISFGFAVSCGEQAALLYLALGVAILTVQDAFPWRKKYGFWTLVGSGVWLVFSTTIFLPLMRSPGQINLFALHYSNWGIESGLGLVAAMFKDPARGIALMLDPARWAHILWLLGLPLLLALFSRRTRIILVLFPFYFFMSDQEFFLPFHAYYFWFAFLAGYLGLISVLGSWEISTRTGTGVVSVTLLVNILTSFSALGVYGGLEAGGDKIVNNATHLAFRDIPRNAGVYSPHRFSEYLSDRPNMVMGDLSDDSFDFGKTVDSRFSLTGVHSDQIDYIVCDVLNDQCGWRQDDFDLNKAKNRAANIARLIQSGQWQLSNNQNNVVILRRVRQTSQ